MASVPELRLAQAALVLFKESRSRVDKFIVTTVS